MIKEDVALLNITRKFSFTSDFFDKCFEYADQLIQKGLAYCDDTPADQMKMDRENRVESKNRNNCKLVLHSLFTPTPHPLLHHLSHLSMFAFFSIWLTSVIDLLDLFLSRSYLSI